MKNVLVIMITLLAATAAYGQVWSSGYETGDLSEWDTIWGTPSVVTTLPGLAPLSGTYMAMLAPDAYADSSRMTKALNIAPGVGEVAYGHIGIGTDAANFPGSSNAIRMHDAAGGPMCGYSVRGDGSVHEIWDWQVDTYGAPTLTVAPGEWLKVSFETYGDGSLVHVIATNLTTGLTDVLSNPYVGGCYVDDLGTIRASAGRAGVAGFYDGNLGTGGAFDDFAATPEPMTMTLLGLGAIGLIRRKRA